MKSESSRRTPSFRRLGPLIGAVALLTSIAACGGTTGAASEAAGDRPRVLAAFYPLEWAARRIAGSDVEVTALTKPGVEPHDLELTPRQIADIERARLVVYLKGVQPAVDEAVNEHAADRSFDVATAVATVPAAAADPHDGEEGEAHEGEESEVGYDPHIWLDPARFAAVATKLGERMAEADPAHAAAFRQRAATTAADLTALDREMGTGLATCTRRTIVTSHAAFAYLAERYKLKQVGISGIDPDSEPSPARLAEVAGVAKHEKVTTIFTEELVSPKVAEILAKEVGATTSVLNPIESRPASGDYLSATRENLAHLRTALGCT